jgi:membrane protease YdiL (CAAX protease family)
VCTPSVPFHRAAADWHLFSKPESSKAPRLLLSLKARNDKVNAKNAAFRKVLQARRRSATLDTVVMIILALVPRKIFSLAAVAPIVWSRKAFALGFLAIAAPLLLIVAVVFLTAIIEVVLLQKSLDDEDDDEDDNEFMTVPMMFMASLFGADGGGKAGIAVAIGFSIAVGIGEELLFRGVLQALLQRFTGIPVAVAISAAVFGACHPHGLLYTVVTGLFGGYFSFLWMKTNNLAVPIIAHAVWDALVLMGCRHELSERAAAAKSKQQAQADDVTSLSTLKLELAEARRRFAE